MEGLPAVSIDGAKGVGKTATASRLARTTIELDDPDQAALLAINPGRLDTDPAPILLDEWQRFPRVWDLARRAVDRDARPGRFILTGSATPSEPVHSGAGRIVRLRMRPMGLTERGLEQPTVSIAELLAGGQPPIDGRSALGIRDYAEEITRSGFPAIRRLEGRHRVQALDGYIASVTEHDFAELGHVVRRPAALLAWLQAFAAATGTTASYETILAAATPGAGDKPARSTAIAYRDVLTRLWVLDQLPAWTPTRNRLSALTGAPKHFLADPALAARLLGVGADALVEDPRPGKPAVRDGRLFGALFEALVALTVRVHAELAGARVRHLRTKGGDHEIDLILERDDGRVVAIEAKLGLAPTDTDVKHLRWLRERLGSDLLDAVVVTAGPLAGRRPDGIGVVPLALIGP
jgi:predicted AAA+ superfamily ATPase